MPIPPYVAALRAKIGHDPLLVVGGSAIVRDGAGRVLLIRRGDNGRWALPGGMMEPGERIAECVVRETREETGVEVEVVRLVGIYSDPAHGHVTLGNGDELYVVIVSFECRAVSGAPRPDGDESLDVAYFAPGDLPASVQPWHRMRIEDALAGGQAAFVR
ncbi:MAG TPA: NUDIX domain-containing protein [Anaerolineae bacterium]|nr:NUDIX domain-containing protein [Anaerolineae bacterium]